jgi:hypothetical protein
MTTEGKEFFLRAPRYKDFLKNDSYSADQVIHREVAYYAIFIHPPITSYVKIILYFPQHFATVGFLRRTLLHETNYVCSQTPSIYA